MERIFTKDMGRFRAGEVRDYPWTTWTQMGDPDSFSTTSEKLASSVLIAKKMEKANARKAA